MPNFDWTDIFRGSNETGRTFEGGVVLEEVLRVGRPCRRFIWIDEFTLLNAKRNEADNFGLVV
jgi:hypothetical protein